MSPARPNSVLQSGRVTPGHMTSWTTDGVAQDSGISLRDLTAALNSAMPAVTPAGDVFNNYGFRVVAAHSLARRLFAGYSGYLFQVQRASDSATLDVGVLSTTGFADIGTLVAFLSNTTGKVTQIYDQTGNANNLPQPTGANQGTLNIRYTAAGQPTPVVTIQAGQFYRNRTSTTLMPTGTSPTTEYMVVTNQLNNNGIGTYGNMEIPVGVGDGTHGNMFALTYGTGNAGGNALGPGPWVGVDFEDGLDYGNFQSPTERADFVSVLAKVNPGKSPAYVLKGQPAGSSVVNTIYSGALGPPAFGPITMKLGGGISLGEGGDGTSAPVEFIEGVVVAGFSSDATDQAIQNNLAQTFGGSGGWEQYPEGLATGGPLLFRGGAVFEKLNSDNSLNVIADLSRTNAGVFKFVDVGAGFGVVNTNYFVAQAASGTEPGLTVALSTDTPLGLTGLRVAVTLDAANDGTVTFGTGGTAAADLFLYRQQSGVIGITSTAVGSGATGLWAYNTLTSPTNYERAAFDWVTTPNVLTIGTQKGSGGGSTRNLQFEAGGTNILDFGVTSTNEWTFGGTAGYSLAYIEYLVGKGPSGSAPSYSFKINTDAGGTARIYIGLDGSDVPFVGFNGTTSAAQPGDTILNRQAAGVFGIGTSTTNTGGSLKLTDLYTNDASFLIRTGTALTDAAAGQTATLTNSPTAGNPTKWISIDDNGTTRRIPAW